MMSEPSRNSGGRSPFVPMAEYSRQSRGVKESAKDPDFTGGKVGRKRKKRAPKGSKKKANMIESGKEDTKEVEELPMHDDDNVHNGVNEEAIQEDEGTDNVQSQGPVRRKRRRRARRVEEMSGEEDAEPPQEVHAGSRGPGGVWDLLVMCDQPQQILYSGGLVASVDLQSASVSKQEPYCLEQAGGAHPGLVFPAQASMFPAQAPALSHQELALVFPTSMDTQLSPSLLDTAAFESISGWIPLEGGERVTEDEPRAQPPYPQPLHPQLPHAQLPHPALPHPQLPHTAGGLMTPAGLQSAVVVKQEPDCLEQAGGAHPGLVSPAQTSIFPAQAPAISFQELASVLPTSMDTQLGPRMLDTAAFESMSGWIPLEGGERVTEVMLDRM
eukprot:gene30739-biopygen16578